MAVWHSHVGVVVEDMEKAMPFWIDVLGFRPVRSIEAIPDPNKAAAASYLEGVHVKVNWIRHGDFQVELIDYVNRKDRVLDMGAMDVNSTHVGFFADDIQRQYDRIESGGTWFRSKVNYWSPESATVYGKDPDGNWFQLMIPYSPEKMPRAYLPLGENGLGHSHYGIIVNSMDDALPFYRDLMGMEVVKHTERKPDPNDERSKGTHLDGISLTEIWVRKGNFIIELVDFHNKKDARVDMGAMDVHATHSAFFCDSVQEEHARLTAEGIWFRGEPCDAQGNPARWVYGKDPDGNWFELIALPEDGKGALSRP